MSAAEPSSASKIAEALVLVALLVACLGVGGIGAWWTTPNLGEWYVHLRKPPWNPPGWLFGPIWTFLYVLMAVAAWQFWRVAGLPAGRVGLACFLVQLALNLAWPGLFFAQRNPTAGLVCVVLLWLAIVATLLTFSRYSPLAAWLLTPYLAWVTFASALNGAIVWLNH